MNKYEEAVAKLIALTKSGDIGWEKLDDSSLSRYRNFSRRSVVGFPYFAELAERHLAIYETSFPTMDEDGVEYVKSIVCIEQVSVDGKLEYAWPIEADMWKPAGGLLNEVRRRTSGAADVVAAILAMGPRAKGKDKK